MTKIIAKKLKKRENVEKMNIHFSLNQSRKRFDAFLLKFPGLRGAKECKSCRSRKMLKNAPTLAIVAVHTEENEPLKNWGVIQFNIHSPPHSTLDFTLS